MQKSIKRYFPIFVLPTLAAFIVAFLVPFVMGIYLSFCEFTTVIDARFVGLSNYVRMLQDKDFLHALGFTSVFTAVSIITINIFAFLLALALTQGIKGSNLFRTVFFMPNLIGGIVQGYIWQLIINGILLSHGVTITTDAKYGFWGLVVLMNWQLIGYMMIIYIAGIQNISTELIEAARIDGASNRQILKKITIPLVMPSITIFIYLGFGSGLSVFMFAGFVKSIPLEIEEAALIDGSGPLQTFFGVVLPILKPTVITVAILNTMWIWNDYLLPYLVIGNDYKTIPIAVQYLRGGYGSIDMGAMMAMLVLAIIPVIIFYLTCQKYIIKGVAAGAVKG